MDIANYCIFQFFMLYIGWYNGDLIIYMKKFEY